MIDKDFTGFTLYCDLCDSEGGPFDYFDEAVEAKEENKWKSRKINGQWQDICPDCQHKED